MLATSIIPVFLSAYVLFNMAEAAAWWALAGYFVWRGREAPVGEIKKVCFKAALAAFIFGISDCLEISLGMCAFTWTIKCGAGLSLFACLMRYDYLKRGAVALSPWRFVAAALILAIAIYMWLR